MPALPMPVTTAVCGELAALSATEIAAVKVAPEVGEKVTVTVQVAPAASDEPQLLVSPKLEALAPVTEMPVMASAVLPGFANVMGSGDAAVLMVVLGKASGLGVSTACGISGAAPVPVRASDCGEPVALSAMDMAADRLAAEAGVKLTVMVQLDAAASDEPQLLVSPKLLALAPVMEMLAMVRAAFPGFERVMGSGVAEDPTVVLGKASGLGVRTA